jgi:transposase InsO family protein
MTYRFMDAHRGRWAVGKMAKVLEVSPSGYYAWKARRTSFKAEADAVLVGLIKEIQTQHKGRYGSPRVHQELKQRGYPVGRNRIARLMCENKLNCRPRKKFIATTNSRHHEPVAPNILDRQFTVQEANRVWVSDITYLPTTQGWLYLCVVIDLFDRMVVGWSMRADMTADIVVKAFLMAVMRRRPKPGLLFHSDRGVQYCAKAFREASEAAAPSLVRSMSRKGNCWDNACAESFFKTLKRELEELDGRKNRGEVRGAVFEYIEAYYNRVRLHSRLGYKPPSVASKRAA